jgi:DNA repair and recombination protein RAD52
LDANVGGVVQGRAPLADVSNNAGAAVAMGISGPDVKRLKMG